MENGAINRTTCWELRGPDLLGMRSGSKSGGKYLLRTLRSDMLAVRRGGHGHVNTPVLQKGSTPENIAITMQFWKPGTVGPGSLLDRASETEDVVLSSAPTPAALSLQAQRERLPIFKHRKVQKTTSRVPLLTQNNRGQAVAYDRDAWGSRCCWPNWMWKDNSYFFLSFPKVNMGNCISRVTPISV